MPKGKGTYGSKKGRPKKPNAHHPMSFNAKRVEAVKAGKNSFEVGGKSFPVTSKAMKYKPTKHKGPFMMKPGSKEVDSPGSFKTNEPAMLFKKGMSGVKIKKQSVSDTKEFSSAGVSTHSEREFSKRSGKPLPYRKSKGYGQDEMVTKNNIPVETVVSKITGKSYDDVGGRFSREGQTERHERVEGTRDKFKKIGKKKFGLKPSMYGKPKMYGKKK